MFWFFGHEALGTLTPWPRIEPAPPALEGEVLTTGPPGKSQELLYLNGEISLLSKAHDFSQRASAGLNILGSFSERMSLCQVKGPAWLISQYPVSMSKT